MKVKTKMAITTGRRFGLLFSVAILMFATWIYAAKSRPKLGSSPEDPQQTSEKRTSMDGTWEGTLGIVKGPGLSDSRETLAVRLMISDGAVRVFAGKDLAREVKPGKFRAEVFETNAVIFASNSGHDKDGTWIETQAFVVTVKDHNTLIANHLRVVNNIDLPLTNDDSKFSTGYSGELKRVLP